MVNAPNLGQQPIKLPENVRKGLLLGLACLLLLLGYYNLRPYVGIIPDRPDDFEVVFKYGFGQIDILDTRAGTFTREMVNVTDVTIPLTLTEVELDEVWAYVHLNHFYPLEEQNPARASSASPAELLILSVHADGYPDKTVRMRDLWMGYTLSERRFIRITDRIKEMIKAKPGYDALPKRIGGYA